MLCIVCSASNLAVGCNEGPVKTKDLSRPIVALFMRFQQEPNVSLAFKSLYPNLTFRSSFSKHLFSFPPPSGPPSFMFLGANHHHRCVAMHGFLPTHTELSLSQEKKRKKSIFNPCKALKIYIHTHITWVGLKDAFRISLSSTVYRCPFKSIYYFLLFSIGYMIFRVPSSTTQCNLVIL